MRLAITGAKGQLGRSLREAFAQEELLLIDLPEHDVSERSVVALICDWQPDLVIHAAAITDVDGCERARPWEERPRAYFEDRQRA